MTDNAKTARLWLDFHHLSEPQKTLSIALTEQIAKSLQCDRVGRAQFAAANKSVRQNKTAVCRKTL
jgi:hypothetical protein